MPSSYPQFESLYIETIDLVSRNLRRFGVPAEMLDDAIQDVYLVIHRRFDTFQGRAAISTWIYAIVRRVAANHRRREARSFPPECARPESHNTPFEEVARQQAGELVLQLLDELRSDRREVFVLTELESLSGPEIADALELDIETVYGRLRAARGDFERALSRFDAREQWLATRGALQSEECDPAQKRQSWACLCVSLRIDAPPIASAASTASTFALTSTSTLGGVKAGLLAVMVLGLVLGAWQSLRLHQTPALPKTKPEAAQQRIVSLANQALAGPLVNPDLTSLTGLGPVSEPASETGLLRELSRQKTASAPTEERRPAYKSSTPLREPAKHSAAVHVPIHPAAPSPVAMPQIASSSSDSTSAISVPNFALATLDSDPAGSDPAGSAPAGLDSAGSDSVGSAPAGSDPAGSDSAGLVPTTSSPQIRLDVAGEALVLRQAQQALEAGDFAATEKYLRQHAQQSPHGALTREREAMRVKLACRKNEPQAASQFDQFRREYGDLAIDQALRQSCPGKSK